ncbi:MAG: M24 family metallopeptidase [Acidimicrobiales bacterium]
MGSVAVVMTAAAERISKVRASFEEHRIDALVVSHPTNIRYLTGFSGSAGTLVVTSDQAVLITDARYALRAPEEISEFGAPVDVRVAPGGGHGAVSELIEPHPSVGAESEHLSWAAAERLAGHLEREVVPTTGVVEAIRISKSAEEIATIRAAAAIADRALADVSGELASGLTEQQFANGVNAAMQHHGADRPGFDTIVATGLNGARPHHAPGDTSIERGDLVIVDFGAELDGYRSDMTRSFIVGEPTARQSELLEAVRVAQAAGVDAAGPGVPTKEIDRACRTALAEAGLADWFTHGTGHGVGLDIHEAPSVSAASTATLAAGYVITVEPGVYLPDEGGVRWEDTLVITADGAEALTHSAKQPVITV